MELNDNELRKEEKPDYYEGLPEALEKQIDNIEKMDIYAVSFSAVTINNDLFSKNSNDILNLGKVLTKQVLPDNSKALNLTLLISLHQYFYESSHLLSIFYNLYKFLPNDSNVRLLVGDAMHRHNKANDILCKTTASDNPTKENASSDDASESSDEKESKSSAADKHEKPQDSAEERKKLKKIIELDSLIDSTAEGEYKNALDDGTNWINSDLVKFGIHLLKTKGIGCYVDKYSKWLPIPPNNEVKDKDKQKKDLEEYEIHEKIIDGLLKEAFFKSRFSKAVLSFLNSDGKRKNAHFDINIAKATSERFVKEEYIAFSRYCAVMREQHDTDLKAKDEGIPIIRDLENDVFSSAILYPFKDIPSNPHAYLVCKILEHHGLADASKYVRILHNNKNKWTLLNPTRSPVNKKKVKSPKAKTMTDNNNSNNADNSSGIATNTNTIWNSSSSESSPKDRRKLSISDFIGDEEGLAVYAEYITVKAEAIEAKLYRHLAQNKPQRSNNITIKNSNKTKKHQPSFNNMEENRISDADEHGSPKDPVTHSPIGGNITI